MKLKVFIGVIGSGKGYEASKCDATIAFADGVRSDIWKLIDWEPKTSEEYEQFKSTRFIPIGYDDGVISKSQKSFEFTGRDLLQRYGTDIRRAEDPDYWVKRLINNLELYRLHITNMEFTVGISDCRFPNEIKGLINYADTHDIDLVFVYTNYKSSKYFPYSTHESEKLAQKYLRFKGTQKEFNTLIKEEYGI